MAKRILCVVHLDKDHISMEALYICPYLAQMQESRTNWGREEININKM